MAWNNASGNPRFNTFETVSALRPRGRENPFLDCLLGIFERRFGKIILLQIQGFRFGNLEGSARYLGFGKGTWLQHGVRQEVRSPKSWRFERSSLEKMPMSVIFPPAILGLEMAVPILWPPWNFCFFLLENKPMPIKFLVLGEGEWLFWTGWKRQVYFNGRVFFLFLLLNLLWGSFCVSWSFGLAHIRAKLPLWTARAMATFHGVCRLTFRFRILSHDGGHSALAIGF